MKKVITFLLSSLVCLAADAGIMSSYTSTNQVLGPDLLILDSKVGSPYVTRSVAISNLLQSQAFISNRNFSLVTIHPTNVFTDPTITYTGHGASNWLLVSPAIPAYMKVGDSITFTTNALTPQFNIVDITNGNNTITVAASAPAFQGSGDFTNAHTLYQPAGFYAHDDNDNPGSCISPGPMFLFGSGSQYNNAGQIIFGNGANTWEMQSFNTGFGFSWGIGSLYNNFAQLACAVQAPKQSLFVLPTGVTSLIGITNINGNLLPIGSAVQFLSQTAVTPSGTITGAANGATFTSSASDFTSAHVGWSLVTVGHTYTISKIVSATVVDVSENIASTITSQAFTLYPATEFVNLTPDYGGAITSGGEFTVNTQTGSSIRILNDTNSFVMNTGTLLGTQAFQLGCQEGPGFRIPFVVCWGAPQNSLCVLADGEVAVNNGLTNYGGALIPCPVPFYPLTLEGGTTMTANTTSNMNFNSVGQWETIYNTSASTIANGFLITPTNTTPGQIVTYFTHGAITAMHVTPGILGTVTGAALTSMSADTSVSYQAVDKVGTVIRIR